MPAINPVDGVWFKPACKAASTGFPSEPLAVHPCPPALLQLKQPYPPVFRECVWENVSDGLDLLHCSRLSQPAHDKMQRSALSSSPVAIVVPACMSKAVLTLSNLKLLQSSISLQTTWQMLLYPRNQQHPGQIHHLIDNHPASIPAALKPMTIQVEALHAGTLYAFVDKCRRPHS